MAQIGFYNNGNLIDESAVTPSNLEFNRERITAEAQDLANECGCEIDVWEQDDDGEQTCHTGITVQPNK
jgi:hypothetical protein